MKTPAKIALVALLAGLGACDLAAIGSQATAKTVAVSTLLTTQPVTLTAAALPAFDAGAYGFDGGFSYDGGLPFDAGGLDASITIPPQNVIAVFFGQRQGDSLNTAPVGTPGATVTLTQVGGPTWTLSDLGSGNYALLPDAGTFTYTGNATYDFTYVFGGTSYVSEIQRAPAVETIAKFHEGPFIGLDAGDSFSFVRVDPPNGEDRQLGFVTVFPVSITGAQGQPTYSNVPTTALGFLKLVVSPSDWKQSIVTVPGSAFPDRNANYLIVLQSAKLGGPKSLNLFSGSAILAGTADIGVVKTAP